ncbi:hypothetical protein PoMZ_13619 [Pyricularia oryzae]|uniref:Benzoate 4-monooxygenase cytochrome P450 n=1 Tax=Pyricularia oryzae TaxID=318829 RepID=A0A4P7NXS0_PYROR|nr:hypothetical protein PoMZ_13619 [Pyricularia oryzae]
MVSGPFLAKVTELYAAYHGWKGDIHLDMWRCHMKYGNHVRYGPNAILFNTSEGMRDIYRFGSSSSFIKGLNYEPMVHRTPNTLTMSGGKEHARRRRILSYGLSGQALRDCEGRITRHILSLCRAVTADVDEIDEQVGGGGRSWGKPVDMSELCSYLSFDIMADVMFGAKYNLIEEPKFRYIVKAIENSNTRLAALAQAPRFARLKLDKYIFRSAIESRTRFLKFLGRMLNARLEELAQVEEDKDDDKHGDLFGSLINATDPETGSKFTTDELLAESATLVFAGTDTASISLAALLFYLAHNPTCYQRAATEVRDAFGSEPVQGGPALASCVYLKACINEAMRMSPPVGGSLWREVTPPEGSIVDGQLIPQGCTVGVGLYSIQHSEVYYEEPFRYNPDRWLGNDANNRAKVERALSAFAPFSLGPRSCLGKGFAQHELMLAAATILKIADFRIPKGVEYNRVGCGRKGAELGRHRPEEYQLRDHITGQNEGPVLQFLLR